jgi:hypothetical protein
MEFFQFTGEGLGVGGRELGFAEAAGRSGVSAERRKYVQKLQDGGFLPRAATVKPRWATEISFNGLTRRNCARTSAGEAITTLSPRDNVAQASRLPLEAFDGGAGETPALLCGGDRIVVTTAMRASAGTRFNGRPAPMLFIGVLHPIQPARRAVGGRAAVLRSPNWGGAAAPPYR